VGGSGPGVGRLVPDLGRRELHPLTDRPELDGVVVGRRVGVFRGQPAHDELVLVLPDGYVYRSCRSQVIFAIFPWNVFIYLFISSAYIINIIKYIIKN